MKLQQLKKSLICSNLSMYRIIGIVKDAVFNLSIGPVINVCRTIISRKAAENGSSNWRELKKKKKKKVGEKEKKKKSAHEASFGQNMSLQERAILFNRHYCHSSPLIQKNKNKKREM